ncbi:MAG: hypothetical protein NVS3B1_16150 [Marmoricola sp.]
MSEIDLRLERLRELTADFAAFCAVHGNVSEADTRAKVIDGVLKDVCGWPEAAISREVHVDRGFVDYELDMPTRKAVVVEAKKEGIPFTLPVGPVRTLKLSGVLTTDVNVREAIQQVRGYCDDAGVRHAIATNGYAWIIFRAIRDDMPWREGTARVFPSLEAIAEHFTEFHNLLSYEAIAAGSLEEEFGATRRATRQLLRVGDRLFNSDLPLQRNRLNAQLTPLIGTIFSEIADQDQIEILENCYVHSASLRVVASDLEVVISDSVPKFLTDEGAQELPRDETGAGFSRIITRAIERPDGELFLILGGIGAGKTTFAKSYQRRSGKGLLDSKTIWFSVDFLKAPLDPLELERFVLSEILQQLRERYQSPHLETRRNIKRVFAGDIAVLQETALRGLQPGSEPFERALDPYLERWRENLSAYVPGLLRFAKPKRDLAVVIFIDNVDQLSPAYQAQIFLLAERLTRTIGSVTIVSLREESYYTASVQRTFTAYANRKFHIASPRFRVVIGNRIQYALRLLKDDEEVRVILPGGIEFDVEAIGDLLTIVQRSIFQGNRSITRFIEAICFGNTRLALQMFTTFLTSGATAVDKMLLIFRRDGSYYVAFHEFVKSIMLGDRKYYREAQSPVMNLFDCGAQRNASHFTAVRLLRYLAGRRGESTPQGQGYVPIANVVGAFEDVFDNLEDVTRTLNRLVTRQLVEVNTRSTESIDGAEFVRLTSAGWYYDAELVHSFAYLDLVLQDTPLDDEQVVESLKRSVFDVDNLGDKEENKLERMDTRFARVDTFISYLEAEETAERELFGLDRLNTSLAEVVMPGIRARFVDQRQWISRRLRENREKDEDDTPSEVAELDLFEGLYEPDSA